MSDSNKVGSVFYELDLDDAKFKKGMQGASEDIGGFKGKLQEAEAGSTALLASITALGVGIAVMAISSIQKYEAFSDAVAQTNQVIKSTGGVAGVTQGQVDDLANSLGNLTKFTRTQVTEGENLLLTFTNIGSDIFPQATSTILDMSQALGQDLKSSAIQVGKALQDPVLGVTALRRVGVNFNDAQKEVIKNLVETGRSAEAQALILKELQTEFGGSAEAAGKTFAGQLAILRNKLDNLQIGIGELIANALQPLLKKFNEWFDSLGGLNGIIEKFNDFILKNQVVIYGLAGAIIGGLIPAIYGAATAFTAMMTPLIPFLLVGGAIAIVIKLLSDHFGGLQELLDATTQALQPFINALEIIAVDYAPQVQQIFMDMVNLFTSEFLPILNELWDYFNNQLAPALLEIVNVIQSNLNPIISSLIDFVYEIVKAIQPFIDAAIWLAGVITETVKPAFEFIVGILGDVLPPIIQFFTKLIQDIAAVFQFIWPIIQPIIQLISDIIQTAFILIQTGWEKVVKPALEEFGKFWGEHIAPELDKFKKPLQDLADYFLLNLVAPLLSGIAQIRQGLAILRNDDTAFANIQKEADATKFKLQMQASGNAKDFLKQQAFEMNTLGASGIDALSDKNALDRARDYGYNMANGGDFIVPSGFPNDSFPINVSSGEKVNVTPADDFSMQPSIVINLNTSGIVATSPSQLRGVSLEILDAINQTLITRNLKPLGVDKN